MCAGGALIFSCLALAAVGCSDRANPSSPSRDGTPVSQATGTQRSDDLAVSAPYEDIGSVPEAGALYIMYGSYLGPQFTTSHRVTQETPGVPGERARTGSSPGGGDARGF